jgi:hypothetical protein
MNRLAVAAKTLTTAAIAVQIKGRLESGARYRAICKAVHQKQAGQFEKSLSAALQEFFRDQLDSVATELLELQESDKSPAQLARLSLQPSRWTDKLIDATAPTIAAYAIKACLAQQKLMGIDVGKISKSVKSIKQESGDNCGTGAGGFQPGNTCARGGGDGDGRRDGESGNGGFKQLPPTYQNNFEDRKSVV